MALLETWQPIDLRDPDPFGPRYEADPGELIDAASFVAELTKRSAWVAQASCRGQGVDRWWPARGQDLSPLRAICATCPVQDECRAEALARPSHADGGGVWGGTSERQRRTLRKTSTKVDAAA